MQRGKILKFFILLIGLLGITIYIYMETSNLFYATSIAIAYLISFFIGISLGKDITTSRIASILRETHSAEESDITQMIEKFKKGIDNAKPLADLAMQLEEINDRDMAARIGAAYLIGALPIFQISMEVISPRGDKEVITTVWGDRKEPEHGKRIVLSKKDEGNNILTLSITTEENFERETLEMGMKVLDLIISRWNTLIKMYTDPLTGARTRGYLPIIMNKLKDHRESIALMMIDLDHFKEVNDTLGHDMGDKVLQEAIKRIRAVLRSSDEIIRYGGDEFVIVIKDVGLNITYNIANRIKNAIEKPPIVKEIPVTVSIGVAYKTKGIPFNPEKALKIADEALYKAKEKRNTYYVFEAN